jgi:predicted dehydrogenase
MSKLLKVGIIGCGGIATNKHLPALSQLDTVELAAFCDVFDDNAQKAADRFGKAKVTGRLFLEARTATTGS